jgi:hypothetical protein
MVKKIILTIVMLGTISLVSVIIIDVYTEFKLTKTLGPIIISLAALVFITIAVRLMKTVWGG